MHQDAAGNNRWEAGTGVLDSERQQAVRRSAAPVGGGPERLARAGPIGGRLRRGRPRSEKSRKAILQAASELLLERGLASISMEAVAHRAGAGKATIYRWWPSKELLALDALFSDWTPGPAERHDTGSLAGDLLALIQPWSRQLARKPYAAVVAAFINRAQSDPEFAEVYDARFVQPRRHPARVIFARALERGEIATDTDVEAAIDLLSGPFYHRLLHGHAPLTDGFACAIVGYVVAGTSQTSERGVGATVTPSTDLGDGQPISGAARGHVETGGSG